MTLGSLFSGIDGLALGLERAGMRTVWHSEIDPFCNEVLAQHWSGVPNLGDVTKIDWAAVPAPDVLCGGFPCQPASLAGQRRGVEDERWLWPCFAAAIRALRPRYVIAENVPGLLTVSGGSAFGEVLGDLAALGYDAEWAVFPASAVGAPHRRERLWIVGYTSIARGGELPVQQGQPGQAGRDADRAGDGLAYTGDSPGGAGGERTGRQAGTDAAGGGTGTTLADTTRIPAGEPDDTPHAESASRHARALPGSGSGALADPDAARSQEPVPGEFRRKTPALLAEATLWTTPQAFDALDIKSSPEARERSLRRGNPHGALRPGTGNLREDVQITESCSLSPVRLLARFRPGTEPAS